MQEAGFDYDSFADGEKVIVFVDKNPYEQYDDSIKEGSKINFHYYNVFFREQIERCRLVLILIYLIEVKMM